MNNSTLKEKLCHRSRCLLKNRKDDLSFLISRLTNHLTQREMLIKNEEKNNW